MESPKLKAKQNDDLAMPVTSGNGEVTEVIGDLFDAPEGSCLIHACNTQGAWGAGIAKAFKQKYPAAFRYYRDHCLDYLDGKDTHNIVNLQDSNKSSISVRLPLGTALVIPPQSADYSNGQKKHWIICLFTSRSFGRRVDSPDLITNSTHAALKNLKMQLQNPEHQHGLQGAAPGKLYSCRFNSGLFAVPWEKTRGIVEEVGLSMTVVCPPGEA
ncbi:hypothetical protein N7462_006111 [Penicillium macrosclerotiorum]|uniref:uncharacterized protein n=1 Tax=Penicillium macrosclerotiorum TaxID=303699 RepID=UPI00254979AD|nr:uncharacterized protein N7462_006111 [Penicillium macrosclerotiorum]KAJ5682946.1 hypothetical protein N7462_006111 [Penicillium macrosclerotiorum]